MRPPHRLVALALAFATLFAYRQLFLFDPNLQTPTEIDPVEDWFFASSGGTSSLLIYALTAWFVARRRRVLFEASDEPGLPTTAIGASGILFAIALLVWGYYTAAFQVLPLSLAVLLVSLGFFLGGGSGGRRLLMPAAFLFVLGTPIPPPLLNHIIYPMQLATAEVCSSIVQFLGYAVLQSGDLIITNWAIFQVIETCAGLRSTLTLVMAAFVYCELSNLTGGRRLSLILIAPVIGLIVNIMRVLSLIFIPVPESQPEHSLQGIVMMVAGVLILWALDETMSFVTDKRGNSKSEPKPDSEESHVVPTAQWRIWALTVVLTAAGVSSMAVEPWTIDRRDFENIHQLSREIGPWRTGQDPLVVDAQYLGSVRFSNRTWRQYSQGNESVSLFAGTNDRTQRVAGLVSEKTKTLNAGSFLVKDSPVRDLSNELDIRSVVVRTRDGTTLAVHHWYENTKSFGIEILRSMFAIDRSPWRRTEPARVVRLATPAGVTPHDLEAAEERLQKFSKLVRTEMRKIRDAD